MGFSKMSLESQGCKITCRSNWNSQTSDFASATLLGALLLENLKLLELKLRSMHQHQSININQETSYSLLCIISECAQRLHLHTLRNLPLWKLLTLHKKGPFGFGDIKRFRGNYRFKFPSDQQKDPSSSMHELDGFTKLESPFPKLLLSKKKRSTRCASCFF